MNCPIFDDFFQGKTREVILRSIQAALEEDGRDLTSRAVFPPEHRSTARIVAKQDSILAGLPLLPLVMEEAVKFERRSGGLPESGAGCADPLWSWEAAAPEGGSVKKGELIAVIHGPTRLLLKAERIILNFITHMSGIANLTALYAKLLEGTPTRLLDTRKTLPGLRPFQKYAVLMGGGHNHRHSLEDMLMLKDNHIDMAGSISGAVKILRQSYQPCPPIEVECRNLDEVREAVAAGADRIMLDNMDSAGVAAAMPLIPPGIESEVSGGVSLENIESLARISPRGPDFISVGRLTHSAPVADFSMLFAKT